MSLFSAFTGDFRGLQGSGWFMRICFSVSTILFQEPAFPGMDGFYLEMCLQVCIRIRIMG